MSFKLDATYETEVYLNVKGGVTISQNDQFQGQKVFIVLSREQFKSILANGESILNGDFDEDESENED